MEKELTARIHRDTSTCHGDKLSLAPESLPQCSHLLLQAAYLRMHGIVLADVEIVCTVQFLEVRRAWWCARPSVSRFTDRGLSLDICLGARLLRHVW